MKKIVLLSLLTLYMFTQSACMSAQKALNKGKYDVAISKSLKKLQRKKNNDKMILILESAFAKANAQDLERIKALNMEGQPDRFIEINEIYKQIGYRQTRTNPLLPLYISSENRKALFDFIETSTLISESKNKAAEFLYAEANQLMQSNRMADSRKAYDNYRIIKEKYFNTYKDIDSKMRDAHIKGTTYVYYTVLNKTRYDLPKKFMRDLTERNIGDLNSFWVVYHSNRSDNINYDYEVATQVDEIIISPDGMNERTYTETKQIEDGWEYVLDERGNVVKDDQGNDVKRPKIVTVSCNVREFRQFKTVRINAHLQYYNNHTNQIDKSIPATADHSFENRYAQINGDIRALKEETKALANSRPMPYPNNGDMIQACSQTLKQTVNKALDDNRSVIQ